MFAKKVDAKTTPIVQAYEDWERIWMGRRELRRFLAFTGLTAPPHNLRVENLLPRLASGITAGKLFKRLRKFGITWSWNCEVVRRAVLLAVGYRLHEIEVFEHNLVFAGSRR